MLMFDIQNMSHDNRNSSRFPNVGIIVHLCHRNLIKKINGNRNIFGFKSHNMDREIKHIQHADDFTVALRDEISL